MDGESTDIKSPQHGSLNLRSELSTQVIAISVIEQVSNGTGETAVASMETGCGSDGAPSIEQVLRSGSQLHRNGFTSVGNDCFSGPRSRDNQ